MGYTQIRKGKSYDMRIPGEVVLSDRQKADAIRAEEERSRTMPGAALSAPPPTINESAPHPPRPAGTEAAPKAPKGSGRIIVEKRKGEVGHAESEG